jgi:hypothetical protein
MLECHIHLGGADVHAAGHALPQSRLTTDCLMHDACSLSGFPSCRDAEYPRSEAARGKSWNGHENRRPPTGQPTLLDKERYQQKEIEALQRQRDEFGHA